MMNVKIYIVILDDYRRRRRRRRKSTTENESLNRLANQLNKVLHDQILARRQKYRTLDKTIIVKFLKRYLWI